MTNLREDVWNQNIAAAANLISRDIIPKWALASGNQLPCRKILSKKNLTSALPRFMQPAGLRNREPSPTSYLDALRGYAALIVVFFHTFATSDGVSQEWRHQPILNLLDAGKGMVALFFMISGYALSHRLLILNRQGDTDRLLNALASSTFRRYFRLYISCVAACLVTVPVIRQRGYNGFANNLRKESLRDQMVDLFHDMVIFTNPIPSHLTGLTDKGFFHTKYLVQLWTIPVEYRGSIGLFLFILATCKMSTRNRMMSTWAMILSCYIWKIQYAAEFLAGLFIADLSLSQHPQRVHKQIDRTQSPRYQSRQAIICWSGLLCVGLFLLARPKLGDQLGFLGAFPWAFLNSLTPFWWDGDAQYWFWLGPGAFAVILAIDSCPTLQKPLNWRFSQYIGELSFGLYAVHPPFGFAVRDKVAGPIRKKYLGDSFLAHIPSFLVVTTCIIVMADYFERLDRRSVAFSRWAQQKLFT